MPITDLERLYEECPNIFQEGAQVKYDIVAEKGPNEVDSAWGNTGRVKFTITTKKRFGIVKVEFLVNASSSQEFENELTGEFDSYNMTKWKSD